VNLTAPATDRDYPEIEITREPDDGNPAASGEEVLEGNSDAAKPADSRRLPETR
jgi:hypothetical protein